MTAGEHKRAHRAPKWTLITTSPSETPSVDHYISLAQFAERSKIHALVINDTLVEPSVYVTALGDATKSIGLVVGYTTKGEHPYLHARKFGTLDELTKGRFGWAYSLETGLYTEEYFLVVVELLLSSWRDDALVIDRESGVWINTDRLREIGFKGKEYIVAGPGLTKPTPQRLPLLVALDISTEETRRHAAKYSEVVSVVGDEFQVKRSILEVKELAEKVFHRDPSNIKFLAQVFVVVDGADATLEGVPPGYTLLRGSTPEVIADKLELWSQKSGVQGFNIHSSNLAVWSSDIIPTLQERGLFRSEYEVDGGTLRENVFVSRHQDSFVTGDHPLFHYRWTSDLSQEEFESVLEKAKVYIP